MADEGKKLLDTIFDGQRQLDSVAYELRSLARSLARTGNEGLAGGLFALADEVEDVGDKTVSAYSAHLRAECDRADRSIKQMLGSLIQGAA